MIFVDTGYLIGLFDQHDSLFERARAWGRILDSRLLITEYVLVEVVNHFSRAAVRDRARAILTSVRHDKGYEYIPASPALLDAGVKLFITRSDKSWSLTDCTPIHVMQQHGIQKALAYDEHFVQAGFDALLRREPERAA